MIDKFNIRVYGIWLYEGKILLSHENIDGFRMVKLPGGGLELGEGPVDGLVREFREELDIDIEIVSQLHVTENFIQSNFRKNEQVIAIHYMVNSKQYRASWSTKQPTRVGRSNQLRFEWHVFDREVLDRLTFEMDRQAIERLLDQ